MKKMVMFQVAMSVYWWLSIRAFHLGVHAETFLFGELINRQ